MRCLIDQAHTSDADRDAHRDTVHDIKDVRIDYTFERQYLSVHQHAGVVEINGAVYFENTTQWLARLRTVLGLREDWFR